MNQILKHRFTQISRQNNYLFTIRQTPEKAPGSASAHAAPSRILVLKEDESMRVSANPNRNLIKDRPSSV